jgi:hypothetical protein
MHTPVTLSNAEDKGTIRVAWSFAASLRGRGSGGGDSLIGALLAIRDVVLQDYLGLEMPNYKPSNPDPYNAGGGAAVYYDVRRRHAGYLIPRGGHTV